MNQRADFWPFFASEEPASFDVALASRNLCLVASERLECP